MSLPKDTGNVSWTKLFRNGGRWHWTTVTPRLTVRRSTAQSPLLTIFHVCLGPSQSPFWHPSQIYFTVVLYISSRTSMPYWFLIFRPLTTHGCHLCPFSLLHLKKRFIQKVNIMAPTRSYIVLKANVPKQMAQNKTNHADLFQTKTLLELSANSSVALMVGSQSRQKVRYTSIMKVSPVKTCLKQTNYCSINSECLDTNYRQLLACEHNIKIWFVLRLHHILFLRNYISVRGHS